MWHFSSPFQNGFSMTDLRHLFVSGTNLATLPHHDAYPKAVNRAYKKMSHMKLLRIIFFLFSSMIFFECWLIWMSTGTSCRNNLAASTAVLYHSVFVCPLQTT